MSEKKTHKLDNKDNNSEVLNRFLPLVEEINIKYAQLQALSNDDLRRVARNLNLSIETQWENKDTLNAKLIDAYALVKEVARRFSIGNIQVTATEKDLSIARKFDFVQIKEDKAIYKNKWSVGDLSYQWNMIHYDEQILGGILLHYGYAVEMATGEGKTLVATLPVFLNALHHDGVHMMTSNSYLSKRDFEITRPIYMFLGLTVDCIELYERNDVCRKFAYNADITFGTTSSFTFDYLWDHLATDSNECVQRNQNYAIIDELDATLIDDADNPHIVGGGEYYDNSKIYKDNIVHVKVLINDKNSKALYSKDTLHHTASFTTEGIEWLREKLGDAELFKISRLYQLVNFDSLKEEEKEVVNTRLNLQNALLQLLKALTVYEKDIDYVITKHTDKNHDLIAIIDQTTGRLRKSSRWEHGLHTAIEVKEGIESRLDFDGLGVISLKNYLRLYSKVAGMSGTIMAASDELDEIYGLRCACLPTHKPVIRIDQPLRIFRTLDEKDTAILETVKEAHHSGRPVLVGCKTIKRAESLAHLLRLNKIECNQLDAKSERDESLIVAEAGIGNTVTVSTSMAGRGTDIKPSPDAIANGGLIVVGADLFNSVRVNQQLKGRTGRQGNPGTAVFFASLEDSVLRYLSHEDKKRLDKLVEKAPNGNLASIDVREYFRIAQNNMENFQREKRRETARKDDLIAPRRKIFYDLRNTVLHNDEAATRIIDKLIGTEGLQQNEIQKKVQNIFTLFTLLLERMHWINPDQRNLTVPFSCEGQPFTLTFLIWNKKYNFSTFISDFYRHLILATFDKFWKEFVQYVLTDLDKTEIDGLDNKFNEMNETINLRLVKLICHTKIIFNPQPLPPSGTLKHKQKDTSTKKINISFHSLCPCGSGKEVTIRKRPTMSWSF